MQNTIQCNECNYTLFGNDPIIEKTCNICKLAHKVAGLSVSELWLFLDNLKAQEKKGLYNYSGIHSRINFLEEGKK